MRQASAVRNFSRIHRRTAEFLNALLALSAVLGAGCITEVEKARLGEMALPLMEGSLSLPNPGGPALEPQPRGQKMVAREILRGRWSRLLTQPPLIEYKPQEFATATSGDGRVFVGSRGGSFWAFDAQDGHLLWRREVDAGVGGRPLLRAEPGQPGRATVYVGSSGGVLYALDAATGEERWKYQTRGPIGGMPVYDEGLIFFSNGENRVYAVDAVTGAWRWQYDRESPESFTIRGFASPFAFRGRVYVGFSDGYVVALNARNGDVLWARGLGGQGQRFVDIDSTPTLEEGTLYVSSYSGGVFALDPTDGMTRWHYDVQAASTVRVAAGRVFFSASRVGLFCLDGKGRLVWSQQLARQGELAPPVLVGAHLLLLSASDGGTYVVDQKSGELLQFFDPGQGVAAEPAVGDGSVYILANAGRFYAFDLLPG